MTNLSRIVRQLEQERDRIDAAIKALTGLTTTDNTHGANNGRRGTRRFSAAVRRRMAAAQKARWARLRAGKK